MYPLYVSSSSFRREVIMIIIMILFILNGSPIFVKEER